MGGRRYERFTSTELVLKGKGGNSNTVEEYRIKTTVGICMDINPYKFEAPWEAYEFAKEIEKNKSSLVLFASAWTNAHPNDDMETKAIVPDRTETWNYWFNRLLPLFLEEREGEEVALKPRKRAFVFANRVGVEREIHSLVPVSFSKSKEEENLSLKAVWITKRKAF